MARQTTVFQKIAFSIRLLFGFLLTITIGAFVFAQDDDDEEGDGRLGDLTTVKDYKRLSGFETRLTPHGNDLMGDMIDKNTGGITFSHTDISLPGNSGLEVALRRKISQGFDINTPYQQGFGDWVIDLPIVHIAYGIEPENRSDPVFNDGCLDANQYNDLSNSVRVSGLYGTVWIENETHMSGSILHVPGKGLSGYAGHIKTPADPQTDWTSAPEAQDHAGRCATVVVAPDGTKYKFGRHTFRRAKEMDIPYEGSNPSNGLGYTTFDISMALQRRYAVYLITEVEDVHGNWVRYDYTNNDRAELTQIYSNDGRQISINYQNTLPRIAARNSRLISSVSTNGRSWNYEYVGTESSGSGRTRLQKVTLPDERFWSFGNAVDNTKRDGLFGINYEPQTYYKCIPRDVTFDMKHPDGAIGIFRLVEKRHIKPATTYGSRHSGHYMTNYNVSDATDNTECNGTRLPSGQIIEPRHKRPQGWPVYQAMSVVSKTISGPDLPTATWDFEYRNYTGG